MFAADCEYFTWVKENRTTNASNIDSINNSGTNTTGHFCFLKLTTDDLYVNITTCPLCITGNEKQMPLLYCMFAFWALPVFKTN